MTVHPAWLPTAAFDVLRDRTAAVVAPGPAAAHPVTATLEQELLAAGARLVPRESADVVLEVSDAVGHEGHEIARTATRVHVQAATPAALLRGWFALVREENLARLTHAPGPDGVTTHTPRERLRVLDHWDNMTVHPVMGQVERGYAGDSIFFSGGRVREDLSRVRTYARLLAAAGIDAVAINNVNVHACEARLLTDHLDGVARIAAELRAYGIGLLLSVSFGSPRLLGGLDTNDPLDARVAAWWRETFAHVYDSVPDLLGVVVKADSEGQPGPFAYGRSHADGANVLAAALAPFGGLVMWRAFVYDHTQDWRDRTTDRARAAHDHFAPLDGQFADDVVLQVKHGPMDFQVREPVSPVIAALPHTRLAVELQVTQEYTGQQRHVAYLAPAWSEYLTFALDGVTPLWQLTDGLAAVSNVGSDEFWTGHPLAQANLYAFGRLAWDPTLAPSDVLDEWIALTFAAANDAHLARLRAALHAMMDDSLARYEAYTAPLGVGFMVTPGTHYGPSVEGYEYSPWGTYHFADRNGIGVDRTRATGTGYTCQYPEPWRSTYESLETCPDELLLFFHHVPWTHELHSGVSVAQHVYDSRADAVEELDGVAAAWESLADIVGTSALPVALDARVRERLAEQLRSATEWRDQVRSYVFRASGVPDASGRRIY